MRSTMVTARIKVNICRVRPKMELIISEAVKEIYLFGIDVTKPTMQLESRPIYVLQTKFYGRFKRVRFHENTS